MRKRKIKRLQPAILPRGHIERYLQLYGNCSDFHRTVCAGILLIETFYRPLHYRLAEYCITLGSCVYSLILKKPVKSYTIGIGQVGIARILNCSGYMTDPRQRHICIDSPKQLMCVLSSFRHSKMTKIVEQYVSQLITCAQKAFPYDIDEQIQYIGELYNGRYSYGLLLVEVFHYLLNYERNDALLAKKNAMHETCLFGK